MHRRERQPGTFVPDRLGGLWTTVNLDSYIPFTSRRANRIHWEISMSIFRGRLSLSGQGLAEYALILALIAIAAVLALLFLSGAITAILSRIGNKL